MLIQPVPLKLSKNAVRLMQERYLIEGESPTSLFERVARYIGSAEVGADLQSIWSNKFYALMSNLIFLPNTPCLLNGGRKKGQLSACFVIGMEDNLDSILDAQSIMGRIHASGGGTGFDLSLLRPKNSPIYGGLGLSSGPISFMEMLNATTEQITQGGVRRGANMGCLSVYHPDIFDFVKCKRKEGNLRNFNISVLLNGDFLNAVDRYESVNLSFNDHSICVDANTIFELVCEGIWENGEPGVLFEDKIENENLLKGEGVLRPNPCAEQLLLPFESCNLGSINLTKFVNASGTFDYEAFKEVIHMSVRFLDNVITVNKFVDSKIKEATLRSRKIGLGVMGFAQMLAKMGIMYDSSESVELSEELSYMLTKESIKYSSKLGEEKGCVKGFDRRNVNVTCIAPTGSLSILSDCTPSIEPYPSKSMRWSRYLSFGTIDEEYTEDPKFFRSAQNIDPDYHLKILSAWSKHIDSSASKTINLDSHTSIEEIGNLIKKAYKMDTIKGLTMYRDKSRKEQVMVGLEKGENGEEECVVGCKTCNM